MNRIPDSLHRALLADQISAYQRQGLLETVLPPDQELEDINMPMSDVLCINYGGIEVFPNGPPAPEKKQDPKPAPTKGARP